MEKELDWRCFPDELKSLFGRYSTYCAASTCVVGAGIIKVGQTLQKNNKSKRKPLSKYYEPTLEQEYLTDSKLIPLIIIAK
jgi:hypothetical protein